MGDERAQINTGAKLTETSRYTLKKPARMVLVPARKAVAVDAAGKDLALQRQKGAKDAATADDLVASGGKITRGKAPLRAGWLYVRAEYASGAQLREYEVLEDGSFKEVLWGASERGKDVRKPNGSTVKIVSIDHTDKVRVAFSDVQWSWKRYQDLEADEGARAARMLAVVPLEIGPSFETEIRGAYPSKAADEIVSIVKQNKYKYGKVVVLGDWFAEADELGWLLSCLWKKMDDLLVSLRTGRSPADVAKGVTKALPDVEYMHGIALACYQVGFANEENVDKYGEHMSKPLLRKLLAVDERKKIRAAIRVVRNGLLATLKKDGCQKMYEDYQSGNAERRLRGLLTVASHNAPLRLVPHQKDSFLDLPADVIDGEATDPGHQYLLDVLAAKNAAGSLWAKGADLPKDPTKDTQVFGVLHSLITDYADRNLIRDVKTVTLLVKRLTTLRVSGASAFFEVKERVIQPKIPKGYKLVAQLDPNLKTALFASADGTRVRVIGLEQVKVQQIVMKEDAIAKVFTKFTQTAHYKRLLGLVETVNFVCAVRQLFDDKKSATTRVLSLLGTLLGSADTYYNVRKITMGAVAAEGDKHLPGVLTKLAGKRAKVVFSAAGAGVNGIVSALDAYGRYDAGDMDAALAYGASAAVSMAAACYLVLATNPVGWVVIALSAVAVAFGVAGVLFEDNTLEAFAKNGPVRKKDQAPAYLSKPPHAALMAHIVSIPKVVNPSFKDWFKPAKAYQDLFDFLYGYGIDAHSTWDSSSSLFTTIRTLTSIKMVFKLRSFSPVSSEMESFLRIYPKGLGGSHTQVKGKSMVTTGKTVEVSFTYAFDKATIESFKSSNPEVIVFSRLLTSTSNGRYIPAVDFNQGNAARYRAYRVSVAEVDAHSQYPTISPSMMSELFGWNQRVGTLAELTAKGSWDKKK